MDGYSGRNHPGHGPGCSSKVGAWRVVDIKPERAIVLYSTRDSFNGLELDPSGPKPRWYAEISWAFILNEVDSSTTRLIKRTRVNFYPRIAGLLLWTIFAFGDNVMQRTVLQGIKERAEQDYSHPAMKISQEEGVALCKQYP